MSRVIIDKSIEEKIISDYLSGIAPYKISSYIGLSYGIVLKTLKRNNVYYGRPSMWLESEDSILINNYANCSWKDLMKMLPKRNKQAILARASILNLNRSGVEFSSYSKYEDEIIKWYYVSCGAEYISKNILTHRTKGSIESRAKRLGVKTREHWSDEEIDIMMKYYEYLPVDDIMQMLPKRTRNSIILEAVKLKLKNITNKNYSYEEQEFIRNNYVKMTDFELGDVLGRTKNSITRMRSILKLQRPSKKSFISISVFLRQHNYRWKIESMENCQYKCVITGDKFGAIHHLYAMNLIVEDVCKALNIDDDFDVKTASEEMKETILNKFIEEQGKHPLGVCITKELHLEFHKRYGYGDNTPEQFENFIKEVRS